MKYLFFVLLIPQTILAQKDSLLYKMTAVEFMKKVEVNQPINPRSPNYELLDAALFHATNEERVKFKLPAFVYHPIIHKVAKGHSEAMIELDFYNHENPYRPANKYLQDRILQQTKLFRMMGENIAQHDILGGDDNRFCFKTPSVAGSDYVFLNCETKKPIPMKTYAELARAVINGWINSPHHRANILNPQFTVMACAGRLSKNPFKVAKSPFARLTQNFGG